NIDTHPFEGPDLLAEAGAVGLDEVPGLLLLVLVVGADAGGGRLQGGAGLRGDGGEGLVEPGAGNLQFASGVKPAAVEAVGEFHQGGVAPGAHGGDDVGDGGGNIGAGDALPGQQGIEAAVEVPLGGGQAGNGNHGLPSVPLGHGAGQLV